MKSNKRITHAYCVEAKEVLPITGARQFYFSSPERVQLHFLCSTEACRKASVKVTGVNYHVPPQEESEHQTPHYRANPVDEHHADCEWAGAEEALGARRVNETAQQFEERKAKRKLKDYIDFFDPSGSGLDEGFEQCEEVSKAEGGVGAGAPRNRSGRSQARHGTNSLERLVQCYRDAKETLSKEEYDALTFHVKGIGDIPLRTYFRSMERARLGRNDRVLVGGARYTKYGSGFRFDFFDKHQDKPIALYVDPATINAYRFRRYWFELFEQDEQVKYFRVYALGSLNERDDGKGYSISLSDLRHLAITLGPKKKG
jgi:hypothetical protein